MIKNKRDYLFYLKADRIALARNKISGFKWKILIKNLFFQDYIWKFQKLLRKVEYYKNCKNDLSSKIKYFFLLRRYRRLSLKLGYTISANVFGPGLSIAHIGNIIVNSGTSIGCNCRIHVGVNIGTEAGFARKAPHIGDNVYIGPGVKIFGDINIPDGTVIGANSIVNKTIEEKEYLIAGIPAKPRKLINSGKFLIKATKLIEWGIPEKEFKGKTSMEIYDLFLDKGY